MSLINDALKKAQKQRTGEAPPLASLPSVGGQSAASISRRGKPSGVDPLLLRAGIGAAVVLVLAIGGYFALRSSPPAKPSVSQSSSPAAATQQPTANSQSTTSKTPAPALASPQPSGAGGFTLPIAPKPEAVAVQTPGSPKSSSPAAKRQDEPSVASAKEGGSQVSVSPPAAASALPPPKLEPRAMTFIDNIKVAGIRASATDSKVLMNDRVYRLGDVVEHEMGLKLVGITANSLTFEDEKGGRYTRTF